MGRIVERIRAVPPGQAALAVAVIALVTALVYFGGREAGVAERSEAGTVVEQDQRGEAAQQSDGEETDGEEAGAEPLTLTLRGQPTCDTPPAQEYGRAVVRWDEAESKWVYTTHSDGWFDVGETPVAWRVSGGVPPYELMIDGEARDAEQAYEGASGVASVSCAQRFDETFFDEDGRGYCKEPDMDSGLKTISATVTDGAGATAEASVDVYVILQVPSEAGHQLESGKTYRVHGFLLTVPKGMTLEVGGTETADNGGPWVSLFAVGTPYETWISLATGTGEDELGPQGRRFRHPSKGQVWTDGTLFQTYEEEEAGLERKRINVPDWIRRIDEQFDELVESIGRLPIIGTAD